MKVLKTDLEGLLIIEPRLFQDGRGFFTETYNAERYRRFGIEPDFVQDNMSLSSYGVLRGLHYQVYPYCQSKLVYVIEGSVLDVAVDMRKNSPTYGRYVSVELNSDNRRQFFIPHGFAHGFAVLSDTALLAYKCDNFYAPDHEAGIRFDDKDLNIDWKIPSDKLVLSDKDKILPAFKDVKPL